MKSLRSKGHYNRQMAAWERRRGEGNRFHSLAMELKPAPALQEADYWKEMTIRAIRKAKAILGQEEYCRRLDILWPDDEPRTWEENARINREILNDPRWACNCEKGN